MRLSPCLLLPVVAAAASLAHAETMRCGKWVVSADTDPAELIGKCGEPTSKESHTSDVRRSNDNGQGSHIVGTTTTERWYYDRGPRSFRMVVTLIDGKIKSIDRAD